MTEQRSAREEREQLRSKQRIQLENDLVVLIPDKIVNLRSRNIRE